MRVFVLSPTTPPPRPPQVSELRQQLRKRGLPVSGTKPALLQRLRLFQLPRPHVPPAPLCQLGTGLEPPLTPSSSSSSRLDSPAGSPGQPFSLTDRGIPIEILAGSPDGGSEGGALSSDGYPRAVPVTLSGDGGGLGNAVFLAPASATSSGTPSPSLPMSCTSPLSCATPLRHEGGHQREPGAEEKRRLRSRSRTCSLGPGEEVSRVRRRPVKLTWMGLTCWHPSPRAAGAPSIRSCNRIPDAPSAERKQR